MATDKLYIANAAKAELVHFQREFEKILASSFNAITGEKLEISFLGKSAFLHQNNVKLPKLTNIIAEADLYKLRAMADDLALRYIHHDKLVNDNLRPKTNESLQQAFDDLEFMRVEILGAMAYKGVASNLTYLLEDRAISLTEAEKYSTQTVRPKHISNLLGFYLYEKLTGYKLPPTAQQVVEPFKESLDNFIKPLLNDFDSFLGDQAKFAKLIYSSLSALGVDNILDAAPDAVKALDQSEDLQEVEAPLGGVIPKSDAVEADLDAANESLSIDMDATLDLERDFLDYGDENQDFEERGNVNGGGQLVAGLQKSGSYKFFTSEFDEVLLVEKMYSDSDLSKLRTELDMHLASYRYLVARLANKLQRKLLAKRLQAWEFDQEEGYLDPSRLSRIVTDPLQGLVFKQERIAEFKDTVVSILIDNSGSMRGRPIQMAAICADILMQTLERCGVAVEILGFTTKGWKGGNSRCKWLESGEPQAPGRLNDLLHIVYKSANMPVKQGRKNLGLLMKDDILKENIDGEALLWAHGRLLNLSAKRRILMIISDGAPVDDATLAVNSHNYLDDHLRKVIADIEKRAIVELVAIGIGHDVTRYYKQAVTIMDTDQLPVAMSEQLVTLFEA